ncbi:MAG TPA: sialidase family protein [Pseudolabrys sp.]|nr:sialidase family protein [Pseudolabrys sp.]
MPIDLSQTYGSGRAPDLDLLDSKNALYAVWHTGGAGTVIFQRIDRQGSRIAAEQELSDEKGDHFWAQVAAGTGTRRSECVYVAWVRSKPRTTGQLELLYRRSIDAGDNFEPEVSLSGVVPGISAPLIRARGRLVLIAWYRNEPTAGNPSRKRVWLARSTDYGASWERARVGCEDVDFDMLNTLPASFGELHDVLDVAVSDDGRIVALAYPYLPAKSKTPGMFSIMLALSKDAGATFKCFDVTGPGFLPSDPDWFTLVNTCGRPRLAIAGRVLHVSWQRGFDGGILCFRSFSLPAFDATPELDEAPQMLFMSENIDTHSIAIGQLSFGTMTFREFDEAGHHAQWVTMVRGGTAFVTAELDVGEFRDCPLALPSSAIAAMPLAEPRVCIIGLRTASGGKIAIRSTVVLRSSQTSYEQQSATVYSLGAGEWAKLYQVHSDPASPKALFVIWEGGSGPSGGIKLARSLDGGRAFN